MGTENAAAGGTGAAMLGATPASTAEATGSTEAGAASPLGLSWLVGGHECAGAVDMVFPGSVGDIRIANRPPAADEFLTAR